MSEQQEPNMSERKTMTMTRSRFLQLVGAGSAGVVVVGAELGGLRWLAPRQDAGNLLMFYPERGWESVYRDQYRYDRSFTWVCAPNDTHMCRMRLFCT